MIDGLAKIAQSQSDAVKAGTHRGQKHRGHKGKKHGAGGQGHGTRDFNAEDDDDNDGDIDLDDIDFDLIDENALLGFTDSGAGGGGGDHIRSRGSVPEPGSTKGSGSSPHLPPPPNNSSERSFDTTTVRERLVHQCFHIDSIISV